MNINFRQLSFVREYRGYSQTELASKIEGLSQSNLSKYEKGVGSLSDDVLKRIIDFLGFPEEFYSLNLNNWIQNANYRKRSGITVKNISILNHSFAMIGHMVDEMSEMIEFPEFNIKQFDIDDGCTSIEIADFTRRQLNIDFDKPVKNIISILEDNGVKVIELDTNIDLFDGISFITNKGNCIIIINANYSNDRKRFTIAHELGHIVMHLAKEFMIPNFRDKEKEANEFASEFLMPAESIRKSLKGLKLQYLGPLKRFWLTSMASIIRRARDLGGIDNSRYQYLNVELSRKGYKKEEPINVFIDEPAVFYDAINILKDELNYSDQDFVDAFHIPWDEIKKFTSKPSKTKLRIKFMAS